MNRKETEKKIIESFQGEERMMALVFAQWCINNDYHPGEIYRQAYPDQENNQVLKDAIELTVPKEEAGEIPDQTLLNVLSLFGNDELAMTVLQLIESRKN